MNQQGTIKGSTTVSMDPLPMSMDRTIEQLVALFDPRRPLTLRTAWGFVQVIPGPDITEWTAHDIGIQWIEQDYSVHLVAWTAIEEVVQPW